MKQVLGGSAAVLMHAVELITAEFSASTCRGKIKLPLRGTGKCRKNDDYKTLRKGVRERESKNGFVRIVLMVFFRPS